MPQESVKKILRIRELTQRVGLGRSTIYQLMSAGDFPRPLQLSPASVGWRIEEVDEWIESRARAAS